MSTETPSTQEKQRNAQLVIIWSKAFSAIIVQTIKRLGDGDGDYLKRRA